MRLHEIILTEKITPAQEQELKKYFPLFIKTYIKNITKEWDEWWPKNKLSFDENAFIEFWTEAGFAKSADEVLSDYQIDKKDIGPWTAAAGATPPSPTDWFDDSNNFKKFVEEVVKTASESSPQLFNNRIISWVRSGKMRSWLELLGLSREEILKYKGLDDILGSSSEKGTSKFPRGTKQLIKKINNRIEEGKALALTGDEPNLLDVLISRYTGELAVVAALPGFRSSQVKGILNKIKTQADTPAALNLEDSDKAFIDALVSKMS